MEYIRKHLWISGRVQGVFYRYSTQQIAERIGHITGWVRNMPDGRVEALLEGPLTQVEQMVQWCHEGPSGARVTKVAIQDEPFQGEFQDFRITN